MLEASTSLDEQQIYEHDVLLFGFLSLNWWINLYWNFMNIYSLFKLNHLKTIEWNEKKLLPEYLQLQQSSNFIDK